MEFKIKAVELCKKSGKVTARSKELNVNQKLILFMTNANLMNQKNIIVNHQ